MNDNTHTPVLLNEVLDGLKLRPDGLYVDCTFGRGGHSRAILQALNDSGRLFVFDKDDSAMKIAREAFANDIRVTCIHGSFNLLGERLSELNVLGKIDGVLFDLGVSSPQLDNPDAGFSFLRDGDLDMRMDTSSGLSAMEWINQAGQEEISKVLKDFGEERFARRIAAAIVKFREEVPITRTKQLADIIAKAVPVREKNKNPATRSFLAIRIYINNELGELREVLQQIHDVLKPGGRLVVISFHSLEDRIVKEFLRKEAKGDRYPSEIPVMSSELSPRFKIIGKPKKPSQDELINNPRARSAILRIGEKIAA